MKTVRVAAAVICHEGRYFTTMRGYGDFKGYWEFPGGKIEKDETPSEALIREIKEELDMRIKVESFLMRVEHDYEPFHLSMDCFLCSIEEGTPHLKEHLAQQWKTAEQMKEEEFLPADRQVVEYLRNTGVLVKS